MANLVYQNEGTILTWNDSGGDYTITTNNLAAGAGRQGARHDFGTDARSFLFAWRFGCEFDTAPVVDEIVRIYAKTSDGTDPDNDDGTGDAAVSAEDKLKNLHQIGTLVVDQAAADIQMAASGLVWLPHRYFQPVIWNDTADNLQATNNINVFTLAPVPFEIQ
jgi:hypothetical protein